MARVYSARRAWRRRTYRRDSSSSGNISVYERWHNSIMVRAKRARPLLFPLLLTCSCCVVYYRRRAALMRTLRTARKQSSDRTHPKARAVIRKSPVAAARSGHNQEQDSKPRDMSDAQDEHAQARAKRQCASTGPQARAKSVPTEDAVPLDARARAPGPRAGDKDIDTRRKHLYNQ
jgi:hypothetical protein